MQRGLCLRQTSVPGYADLLVCALVKESCRRVSLLLLSRWGTSSFFFLSLIRVGQGIVYLVYTGVMRKFKKEIMQEHRIHMTGSSNIILEQSKQYGSR